MRDLGVKDEALSGRVTGCLLPMLNKYTTCKINGLR